MERIAILGAVAALLVGCVTNVAFYGTDAAGLRPLDRDPVMYWDRDPHRPHRKAGSIVVHADDEGAAGDAAVREGRRQGCEVVRFRGPGPDAGSFAFDCGVWTAHKRGGNSES